MSVIILKNTTGSNIVLDNIGFTIPASDQLVPTRYHYNLIASEGSLAELTPYLDSGDIVVNDGDEDLSGAAGLLHLQGLLIRKHLPVNFSPILGENCPIVTQLNGASYGYSLDINNGLYTFTHLENPVPEEPIQAQLHVCIDNDTSDRWVQFKLFVLTTTGVGDKALNSHDAEVETDQIEVPTNPFYPFEVKTTLPSSLFENEEDNVFLRAVRITATGKTAPANNPIIVRTDMIYKSRIQT